MRKKKNMWRKRNTLKSRYQVIYKQNKKKICTKIYREMVIKYIPMFTYIYTSIMDTYLDT